MDASAAGAREVLGQVLGVVVADQDDLLRGTIGRVVLGAGQGAPHDFVYQVAWSCDGARLVLQRRHLLAGDLADDVTVLVGDLDIDGVVWGMGRAPGVHGDPGRG